MGANQSLNCVDIVFDGWAVRKPDGSTIAYYDTKEEAEKAAKRLAKDLGVPFMRRGKDGRFQDMIKPR